MTQKARKITEIIVHCSATSEGMDFGAGDINVWHIARGFDCIGYHYVVRLDGTVERGRDEQKIGAHCVGHNAMSIGVCYIGGLGDDKQPKDTRTPQQKDALRSLLARLKAKYPDAKIRGHRDLAAKACPCFDATAEYADL